METFITAVQIIGTSIFILSFLPQLRTIYKGKHTIGMSPISWTLNWVGRTLWIFYSMMMPRRGIVDMGIIMLVGQGLIAVLSIPIVYYSIRNRGSQGIYNKEEFKHHLFLIRIGLSVITFGAIIICLLAREGVGFNQTINAVTGDSTMSDTGLIIFGLVASGFTGIAFFPQTIKVIRSKVTKSINLKTTFFFAFGNTLLVGAMFISAIYKGEVSNTGAIILGTWSTILMYTTSTIKFKNMRKLGEK